MDLGRLRHLLSTCKEEHEQCRFVPLAKVRKYRFKDDTFLIDVQRNCLVEAPSDAEFIALSYVWGTAAMLKASRDNLSSLKEEGSLIRLRDQLPQTILDVMILVRELEERYIWVECPFLNARTPLSKR